MNLKDLKDKKVDLQFRALAPFLVQTKIEQELIDLLLEKGNESREKNISAHELKGIQTLAGVTREAYSYEKYWGNWFAPKFSPYLDAYIRGVNDYCKNSFQWKKQPLNVNIPSLWINYQRGYEYLPLHNHDGDVSFVIYLQVPDEIKKENEEMKIESFPGMISFEYGVELPFTNNSFRQLPNVGDCFIFPAWLTHHVYSFKADVERISVSGNIEFESIATTGWSEQKVMNLKDKRVDLKFIAE